MLSYHKCETARLWKPCSYNKLKGLGKVCGFLSSRWGPVVDQTEVHSARPYVHTHVCLKVRHSQEYPHGKMSQTTHTRGDTEGGNGNLGTTRQTHLVWWVKVQTNSITKCKILQKLTKVMVKEILYHKPFIHYLLLWLGRGIWAGS